MNEQNQDHTKKSAEGKTEFKMPDCCGPMMARMMKACSPTSTEDGEAKAEADGTSFPRCCESMMARMRDMFPETSNGGDDESSSDDKRSCC